MPPSPSTAREPCASAARRDSGAPCRSRARSARGSCTRSPAPRAAWRRAASAGAAGPPRAAAPPPTPPTPPPAHHLLAPATGRPAFTGLVQVTALAPTALEAEIRAKAALLSGPDRARDWLPDGGGLVGGGGGFAGAP